MNKYFLADESGETYYFETITEITEFLGVDKYTVNQAFVAGCLIQGYTIDEIILGG